MGNRVARVVLGIILAIAVLVVVYMVLPGNIKHPLQEKIQSTFQKDKYEAVTYLKGVTVPNSDITFEEMVKKAGGSEGSWVIEVANVSDDGKSGDYEIHAYLYKVDISMAQENGQENRKSFTQAAVDIQFNMTRKVGSTPEYVVSTYNIFIDEVGQNNFYRAEALNSMVKSAKSAK